MGNNQAGKRHVLLNAGRHLEEAERCPLNGDMGRNPGDSSITVQSVVRRLPVLVMMGLPLEMLLNFQERCKKPDLSYGLMFQSPVPALPWSLTVEHMITVVFVVAELHGRLI